MSAGDNCPLLLLQVSPVPRLGLCAAAEALGKPRKTLQRWRKREGSPFGPDGSTDLDELRAWAEANGFLGRGKGRPAEADRLLEVAAPAATGAATVRTTADLGELTQDDRAALEALVAGDAAALVDLAAKVDPALLKRLAAMGRTRRELAEAEKREIENRRSRAELVPLEEVKRWWSWQIQVVKGHFQALPGKLSARLDGLSYDERYALLEGELDALLRAFAVEVPA